MYMYNLEHINIMFNCILEISIQHTYQQTLEQYKHQLTKSNMDRRHTVASLDAMRALLQRRLESAQVCRIS